MGRLYQIYNRSSSLEKMQNFLANVSQNLIFFKTFKNISFVRKIPLKIAKICLPKQISREWDSQIAHFVHACLQVFGLRTLYLLMDTSRTRNIFDSLCLFSTGIFIVTIWFLQMKYVTRSQEMSRLSKKRNSEFLTPLSHNFNMLHFAANPIKIGYPVTDRVIKNLSMLKKI